MGINVRFLFVLSLRSIQGSQATISYLYNYAYTVGPGNCQVPNCLVYRL